MNESSLSPGFIKAIEKILNADQVLTDPADVWSYGYDNSRRHAIPDMVVLPSTHEQVHKIVSLCNEYTIPLTPRGRGTGTTGATVPLRSGVVLSTERLNRIIKIQPADRYIVVEPGVTNQQVQEAAKEHGFFWAPDPTSSAYCSVGGNLAYNSAGPRAVKYGTPRENVFGLRAITGYGEEIRTGVFTSKGVVGYDFTRLLIGSEGTLAIITEATLKLTPLAQSKRTLQLLYSDIESAAKAISAIMAQPTIPCALEFIDGNAIDIIRDYSDVIFPDNTGAMLMVEVDGPENQMDFAIEDIKKVSQSPALLKASIARTKEEVDALWATRKVLSPALRNFAVKKINEDVVVPVSNIPALINGLEKLSEKYDIPIVNFGHAGNGNIHVNLLFDPDDEIKNKNAHLCLDAMFDLVLKLNGTLSGEHGVGIEKRDFVDREIEPVTLALMKRIKKEFDPNGILNPDKMFPLD